MKKWKDIHTAPEGVSSAQCNGVLCMGQREWELGRQRRESQKEAREGVVVVEPLRGK